MGFFSRTRQIGSYIVNLKVQNWANADFIKSSFKSIVGFISGMFIPEQADRKESFKEAVDRLQLSKEDIAARTKEFLKLMIIYLVISVVLFSYSLYIAYAYGNVGGFFMGLGITMFSLTNAFRYHFWIYQIKHNKLGCSLKEWFLDK